MLLQAGGLQLYYEATQVYASWSMHQKIARGNARSEQLILSEHVYQKSLVEKDEIRIDGKMYDVLKVDKDGERVNLTVVADHFEGSIINKLQGLIYNWQSDGSALPQFLVDLLESVYLKPDLLTIFNSLLARCNRSFSSHGERPIFESYPVLVQPPILGFSY